MGEEEEEEDRKRRVEGRGVGFFLICCCKCFARDTGESALENKLNNNNRGTAPNSGPAARCSHRYQT